MRPLLLLLPLLLPLALLAQDLDDLETGGFDREAGFGGRLLAGASYRWWRMTSEAQDPTGSLERGRYTDRERSFGELDGQLDWRPWRLALALAASQGDSDPSVLVTGSVLFIGDSPLWWELAPRFTIQIDRRAVDLEVAGVTTQEHVDEQRFELGFSGQGPELAGAEIGLFLARSAYPAVLGFRGSGGSQFSTIDRDFEHWRFGVVARYDWSEQVLATRRRYVGPYAAIWGEMAYLGPAVGGTARQAALDATGRSRIQRPAYGDYRGGIEVGVHWHRQSRQRSGALLKLGWRLSGQVLGIDSSSDAVPADDVLILMWDQYTLDHGPFAHVGILF